MTLPKEIEALLDAYAGNPEPIRTVGADMPRRHARYALEAAIVAYAEEARREAGLTLPTQRVLRYLSWEQADEMRRLAQPLVDHIVAGKLAKRVCDLLLPGTALASPSPVEGDGARGESVRDYVVRICDGCRRLEGKMCSTPGCAFCFRSVSEVAAVLDAILLRPVVDGERLDLMTPIAVEGDGARAGWTPRPSSSGRRPFADEPAPSEPESGGTTP